MVVHKITRVDGMRGSVFFLARAMGKIRIAHPEPPFHPLYSIIAEQKTLRFCSAMYQLQQTGENLVLHKP